MLPRVHLVNTSQGSFLALGQDLITQHLVTRDEWEKWLYLVTNEFTSGFESPIVFDIGANLGAYTVPVASAIEKQGGVVYAFEPQKAVYYQLCGNIFLNRLDNVTALNKAIGSEDSVIEIPIPDYQKLANAGAFSLVEEYRVATGISTSMSKETHFVQVIKLDDLLFEEKTRFVKIDVEGLEIEVLKGAVGFLEHNAFPPFSFEAWNASWFADKKQELLSLINHLGYTIEHIYNDDYIAHHPNAEAKVDFKRDSNGTLLSVCRAS
ncbi:FkbM family methyltransferase [Dickeya undicola]|uniref:FkbM family methyltransferase n=1 Tax=Dickeya undicola TaxID=1577887 RepID=A0A3N0FVN6_9GAMM|nr:FkbM family methyltransferase [Dickeya undicola]RNM04179.1 FkbM family methyltransferase [Dickeya undicola]RNM25206.1 FkbM family methyltransferase [Dickeya undicola]